MENSLPAIRASAALGVKAIEVDVHLTADSVIAVLHDENVGRVTVDGTGLISTLTWAQARALTLKNQGGQIPSLVEVLDLAAQHDMLVLIEVKELHKRGELIRQLVQLFADRNLYSKAIVGAFNPTFLWSLRGAEPRIKTLLFNAPRILSLACHPDVKGAVINLPAPMCWPRVYPVLDWILDGSVSSGLLPRILGLSVLSQQWMAVAPGDVQAWARAGVLMNVWVVNEPSIKEFYLAAGASVTTDCPPVNGSCGFEEAVGFRSRWNEGSVRGPTGATMNVKY